MIAGLQRHLFGLTVLAALPIAAPAQQNVGELFATDASVKGSVILAGSGTQVLSGSQIAAGAQAATLKLERGGSLLVCPGTSLSVTASQNGRQLLFSLNAGNVELDYPIGAAADSLLTPDLRLMLPGPGRIHVALQINAHGDTCVQTLPSNAAALVVSEAMGDQTYQVKADQAVVFPGGHIADAQVSRQGCGCPAPPPTQVARLAAPPRAAAPPLSASTNEAPPVNLPTADAQPATTQPTPTGSGASTASAPPAHLSVDAPFIFHGDDPTPDLTPNVATLRIEHDRPLSLDPVVLPPSAHHRNPKELKTQVAGKQEPDHPKRSLLGKVGAFFAAIFR